MRFGRILQDLREDRDITRKDLASALSISVSTLGMYEQGRREPNIDMLIKMANFFDVSLDFLVGRSYKNENNKVFVEALHLKNEIDKLPQGYKNIIDFMLNTKE